MTKYYSEEQIRDMLEPPAKLYDLEKIFKSYLEAEFKDEPALEIDENKRLVQLTGEQVTDFQRAIDTYRIEYGETDVCERLLGLLGIDYSDPNYWN